jgi:hypothetical protein
MLLMLLAADRVHRQSQISATATVLQSLSHRLSIGGGRYAVDALEIAIEHVGVRIANKGRHFFHAERCRPQQFDRPRNADDANMVRKAETRFSGQEARQMEARQTNRSRRSFQIEAGIAVARADDIQDGRRPKASRSCRGRAYPMCAIA